MELDADELNFVKCQKSSILKIITIFLNQFDKSENWGSGFIIFG